MYNIFRFKNDKVNRVWKYLSITVLICVILLSVLFITYEVALIYFNNSIKYGNDLVDINELGTENIVIVLGSGYSSIAEDRVNTAFSLYENGFTKDVILTGGRPSGMKLSESDFMETVLKEKINDSNQNNSVSNNNIRIIKEENSNNTLENLINAKRIIEESENIKKADLGTSSVTLENKDKIKSRIIIVSNDFHLLRSYLIAKKAGYKDIIMLSPEDMGISERKSPVKDNLIEFTKILKILPFLVF